MAIVSACAAEHFCKAPPVADLDSSPHSCPNCQKPIHCELFCGLSWSSVRPHCWPAELAPDWRAKTDHDPDIEATICLLCVHNIGVTSGRAELMALVEKKMNNDELRGSGMNGAFTDEEEENPPFDYSEPAPRKQPPGQPPGEDDDEGDRKMPADEAVIQLDSSTSDGEPSNPDAEDNQSTVSSITKDTAASKADGPASKKPKKLTPAQARKEQQIALMKRMTLKDVVASVGFTDIVSIGGVPKAKLVVDLLRPFALVNGIRTPHNQRGKKDIIALILARMKSAPMREGLIRQANKKA